jgi:hypothetical protein
MAGQGSASGRVAWQSRTEGRMWSFTVVVRNPLGQNVSQVPFVQWNDPIEALAPGRADEAFAVGVL